MGVVSYNMEVASPIPPAKLFKAFVLDNDNIIQKVVPQAINNVEILQGDGGPGTVRKITFGEGSQFKYVKHRIEEIDKENFVYRYSAIEGDVLVDVLEKIDNEIKFEASGDGGSICKNRSTYYTIGDHELKQEEIKAGKEKSLQIFKAVEAYLLANPHAYS
ncbi:major allergen Pru ar 1 [Jatropha curcas]|uniref:major allergen Pru ar 1 n=1 Tax=Jatropha curcas TaxID=180498 RepID=UPI0005FB4E7A|nr:major allergen Pru ar 1 [Jatropha curcas]